MANNAIKKFLSTIGFEPVDGDSNYLGEPQDEEASGEASYREERMERRERRDRSDRTERQERNERRSSYVDDEDAPVAFSRTNTQSQSTASTVRHSQGNVISMPERVNTTQSEQDKMVMRIVCPTSFEDTRVVIDNLRANKAIVLNIDEIDVKIAQRILDFVSGAVYSLDGDIKKVSRNIYVVAPEGVSISTGLNDTNRYTSESATDNDNYYN